MEYSLTTVIISIHATEMEQNVSQSTVPVALSVVSTDANYAGQMEKRKKCFRFSVIEELFTKHIFF